MKPLFHKEQALRVVCSLCLLCMCAAKCDPTDSKPEKLPGKGDQQTNPNDGQEQGSGGGGGRQQSNFEDDLEDDDAFKKQLEELRKKNKEEQKPQLTDSQDTDELELQRELEKLEAQRKNLHSQKNQEAEKQKIKEKYAKKLQQEKLRSQNQQAQNEAEHQVKTREIQEKEKEIEARYKKAIEAIGLKYRLELTNSTRQCEEHIKKRIQKQKELNKQLGEIFQPSKPHPSSDQVQKKKNKAQEKQRLEEQRLKEEAKIKKHLAQEQKKQQSQELARRRQQIPAYKEQALKKTQKVADRIETLLQERQSTIPQLKKQLADVEIELEEAQNAKSMDDFDTEEIKEKILEIMELERKISMKKKIETALQELPVARKNLEKAVNDLLKPQKFKGAEFFELKFEAALCDHFNPFKNLLITFS